MLLLYSMYSFVLPFWIELKPLCALRSPLIVRVDPNLVQVEERAWWNARRFRRNCSIPEPIVISDQNGYSTLSEFRREPHFQVQTCTLEVSCWCARCRAYWQSP